MKILLKCAAAAISAVMISNIIVYAAPSSEQTQSLNTVQDERRKAETQIEGLDQQIEELMSTIESNKKQIIGTQKNIELTKNEVTETEDKLKQEQQVFNKRIRSIYMSGTDGYLSILLESKGITDFISRVESIIRIIAYDKQTIKNYKEKQSLLAAKQDKLKEENNRLVSLKTDNEQKLENLKSSKETQSKLIAKSKEQEKLLGNLDGNLSVAINQVNSMRNSLQRTTLSRGASLSSANEVIAYASNFLGTPYRWGGTSPKTGFDCSGYTQYVYAHFGINLGRTTYDQIKDGVSVSKSDLKPGDLVFFGSWSNPHHMGIYIGNGAYMHAPRTGDVVKISSIDRGDYVTARRVM